MEKKEQLLIIKPEHELKFRGKFAHCFDINSVFISRWVVYSIFIQADVIERKKKQKSEFFPHYYRIVKSATLRVWLNNLIRSTLHHFPFAWNKHFSFHFNYQKTKLWIVRKFVRKNCKYFSFRWRCVCVCVYMKWWICRYKRYKRRHEVLVESKKLPFHSPKKRRLHSSLSHIFIVPLRVSLSLRSKY